MKVVVRLDQPRSRKQAATSLGPFEEVRLLHRRIEAGPYVIVRSYDGGWRLHDQLFLEARIESVGGADGRVTVAFEDAWAQRSPSTSAEFITLFGDRLFDGIERRGIATDDDQGRCWVADATGLANNGLTVVCQ